jgi:hypothetical protein
VEYVALDTPDFSELLGFTMAGMPDAQAYALEKIFVLDGWYAQLEFRTADGRLLVARVAPVQAGSLTATYSEGHYESRETLLAGDIEVTVRTDSEGCGTAAWQRDGYAYLLHSGQLYGPVPEEDTVAMTQELLARPA